MSIAPHINDRQDFEKWARWRV